MRKEKAIERGLKSDVYVDKHKNVQWLEINLGNGCTNSTQYISYNEWNG
jgi:hypothetical protein